MESHHEEDHPNYSDITAQEKHGRKEAGINVYKLSAKRSELRCNLEEPTTFEESHHKEVSLGFVNTEQREQLRQNAALKKCNSNKRKGKVKKTT